MLALSAPVRADGELVIITTQNIPKVARVINELKTRVGPIRIHDMQGKQKEGDRLVRELASSLAPGSNVITMGTPATMLAARHLREHRVFSTYVGTSSEFSGYPHVTLVESDPRLADMLDALVATWPDVTRVGLIFDVHAKSEIEAQVRAAPSALAIELVPVNRADETRAAMQDVSARVDAFVFLRQSGVLNRKSLPDVVDFLDANQIPAVGYSRYLVRAGFPSAVVTESSQVSRALADAVLGTSGQTRTSFDALLINKKFARRTNLLAHQLPQQAKLL